MRTSLLVLSAVSLASCGQSGDAGAASQSANAAQPKKKPAYCFFKDSETRGWAATRGKDGNIVVHGKAYRQDSRYKATLGPATVTGANAEIAPTIAVNDSAYGAPDDWWVVSAAIPNSAAVDTVTVRCGTKTLANLKPEPKG